jgi:hypothetical protein
VQDNDVLCLFEQRTFFFASMLKKAANFVLGRFGPLKVLTLYVSVSKRPAAALATFLSMLGIPWLDL